MRYLIGEKVLQTDWYEIEANSPEAAKEAYLANPGLAQYVGTDGGWDESAADSDELVVVAKE